MGWEETLKQAQADFTDAAEPNALPMLPDGAHDVTVAMSRCELTSWNEYQWRLEMHNDEGRITKYLTLQNPKGLGWTKKDAHLLGWEGTELTDLARWVPVAVGAVVNVTISRVPRKNDPEKMFVNVYLNTVASAGTGKPADPDFTAADTGTYSAANDDDIPF